MRTGVVYGLYEQGSDAVRYVGQTQRALSLRLSGHISEARAGRRMAVYAWIRDVFSRGGSIDIRPIVADVPACDLRTVEHDTISRFLGEGAALTNEKCTRPRIALVIRGGDVQFGSVYLSAELRYRGHRITNGDALMLMVGLWRWAVRKINQTTGPLAATIKDVGLIKATDAPEILKDACGWPRKKSQDLLECLCLPSVGVLKREGDNYRIAELGVRYRATRQ